ncbi:MAG: lysozyme family protein [[Ruminococcus] gnavus]|nr:lysozyme family protein [Mediterraneibacter gnavus]
MSRDIKVRQVRRDVKVLDRGLTAAEHMKNGFVRIKEQTGQTPIQNQGSSESVAYAQARISRTAESLAYRGGKQAIRQGGRIGRGVKDGVQSVKENASLKRSVRSQAQGINSTIRQSVKTRNRSTQTVRTLQRTAGSIKTGGVQSIKAGGKAVKTAANSSRATVKTTVQTAKAVQMAAWTSVITAQRAAYAARISAKTAIVIAKVAAKAAAAAAKAAIAATKALISAIAAGGWVVLVILIVVILLGAALCLLGSNSETYTPVSEEVEAYDPLIRQYANEHGIGDYVELIKAVMMQESGGRGNDPMQASECPYNTEYANTPNGITDPEYSIDVGIQYLASCLAEAEVESPIDMEPIKLAIQGYNYGNGYISWAKENYGGYSVTNASDFSDMMAAQLGWSSYGDKQYVAHVLRYYPYGRLISTGGSGDLVEVALSQEGNSGGEIYWRWYGFEEYQPWCACFVSWCADQCGYIDAGVIPKFSLCSAGVEWFQARGQFMDSSYTPGAGDLIFFDWGTDGSIDHVGIVVNVADGFINTIEGNSSNKVQRGRYATGDSSIYGYGVVMY